METLKGLAAKIGIELSAKESGSFDVYCAELIAWNERMNLTAIISPGDVAIKHFLDSLSVLVGLPSDAAALVDIGSGAGFPGIPLAIVRPKLDITLIEATAKKVEFLEHVVKKLGLSNVRAVQGRAEDLANSPEYRERFDVATARAVAALPSLVELALPFVRVGGTFIAQKGAPRSDAGSEAMSAAHAIEELGGARPEVIPISLPELADRQLVLIKKISTTPSKYPRRSGMPSKRPLL